MTEKNFYARVAEEADKDFSFTITDDDVMKFCNAINRLGYSIVKLVTANELWDGHDGKQNDRAALPR